MPKNTLDYRPNRTQLKNLPKEVDDPAGHSSPRNAALFIFCSIACPIIPVIGWTLKNGPLFLIGGAFASLIGIICALAGMGANKETAVACGVPLVINLLVASYLGWLVFIRGLC